MPMPVMDIGHVIVLMFLGGMFMLVRVDFIRVRHVREMGLCVNGCARGSKPYARACVNVLH